MSLTFLALASALMTLGPGPNADSGPAARPAAEKGAQARTATLRLRHIDSLNRHSTMGFATSRRLHAEVELTRLADGSVRVTDEGERSHGSADAEWGYSGEKTRWRALWTGTWRDGPHSAQVTLRRTERSCETTETRPRQKDVKSPCPRTPDTVELTCTKRTVRLGPELYSPDEERKAFTAWECEPFLKGESPAPLDSPVPWLLGADTCIETIGGGAEGRSHRVCGKDAE